MDKGTLLLFIERIIHNCNGDASKIQLSLKQLQEILEVQNAPADVRGIIAVTIGSEKELRDYEKKERITMADIENANKHAAERRRIEAELARNGRC